MISINEYDTHFIWQTYDPFPPNVRHSQGKKTKQDVHNVFSFNPISHSRLFVPYFTRTRTAPYAACYKPNAAFFEALGSNTGIATLERVIKSIPNDIPVLLDVKRGDIGSTAAAYADACYDIGADAVTLSPLMGWDSVSPFVTGK